MNENGLHEKATFVHPIFRSSQEIAHSFPALNIHSNIQKVSMWPNVQSEKLLKTFQATLVIFLQSH